MFRSSARNPKKSYGKDSEEKEQDVQVEVSLDLFDKLFSIVVTEATHLQSVVSVPAEDGGPRRRIFRKNKAVNPKDAHMMNVSREAPSRLADSLRPLSPTPKDRHSSAEDSRASRGRGRESHSCPPALSRGGDRARSGSSSRAIANRYRESSCPPPSSSSRNLGAESQERKSTKRTNPAPMKKSKDLVSKTASRSRLFGSMRKAGKVIPAPSVL